MPKFLLGIGKCSRFYQYIVYSILTNIAKDICLECTIYLKGNLLIQGIFKYLGFIVFGIILLIIYKQNLRRFSFNKNRQKLDLNSSKSLILIYNNIKKNFFISKKESSFLLIISFIYALYFEILKLLDCHFGNDKSTKS